MSIGFCLKVIKTGKRLVPVSYLYPGDAKRSEAEAREILLEWDRAEKDETAAINALTARSDRGELVEPIVSAASATELEKKIAQLSDNKVTINLRVDVDPSSGKLRRR